MPKLYRTTIFSRKQFEKKLASAIDLIQSKNTSVARVVRDVISSKQVSIYPFYELSQQKKHVRYIKKNFLKDEPLKHVDHRKCFMKKVEFHLDGLCFSDDKIIYISSRLNIREMAKTLVHEVVHHINDDLYERELITKGDCAHFLHEMRSFFAEEVFEEETRLLRSDVRKIEEKVRDGYPELIEANKPIGFIPIFTG